MTLLVYELITALVGLVVLSLGSRFLEREEAKRKARISQLETFVPVDTTSPVDDQEKMAKRIAVSGIGGRFTIIRRGFLFFLGFIWICFLVFPLLGAIPATIASILVGSVAVIMGIAARPLIENLISGVVITFSKSVSTGDTVIVDEQYGTVEDITITHTIVKVWNWRRYVIPNSQMMTKEFVSCTMSDAYQWAHVEFWVSYEADLKEVEACSLAAAKRSKSFSDYEEPRFWVMEMGKEGIKCWVAAWSDSPTDAWQLAHDIRISLTKKLQEKGIHPHQFHVETTARSGVEERAEFRPRGAEQPGLSPPKTQ